MWAVPSPKSKITSAVWGPLDEVIITGHENGDLCQWDVSVCFCRIISTYITEWPQTWKTWKILRDFSEHGKLRKISQGKIVTNKVFLVRHSNVWSECGGDLLYCLSWCGMTFNEGHYYIYFLLR